MNTVYPLARQRLLERVIAGASLPAATFKAALVGTDYVFDSAHEFFADIEDHVLGNIATLEGITAVNGVLRAGNILVGSLTPGGVVKAVVTFAEWSGGSLLFSYQESATDASLPATLSASSAAVIWSPNGIFRL